MMQLNPDIMKKNPKSEEEIIWVKQQVTLMGFISFGQIFTASLSA